MTAIHRSASVVHLPQARRSEDAPLEPTRERPAPAPFQQTSDTWLKGALIGGGIGGVVGGVNALAILTDAMEAEVRAGGTALGALALLTVTGVAVGSMIHMHSARKAHERAETARIDAEYGTSTRASAASTIASFDHSGDGAIQLDDRSGLASRDERFRTERSRDSSRPWSAAVVWAAADGDQGDRTVTVDELARLMSTFDADRSGTLTTTERQAFDAAHPIASGPWTR